MIGVFGRPVFMFAAITIYVMSNDFVVLRPNAAAAFRGRRKIAETRKEMTFIGYLNRDLVEAT